MAAADEEELLSMISSFQVMDNVFQAVIEFVFVLLGVIGGYVSVGIGLAY